MTEDEARASCRIQWRPCPRDDCSVRFAGPMLTTREQMASIGTRYAEHLRHAHDDEDAALRVERFVIHELPVMAANPPRRFPGH